MVKLIQNILLLCAFALVAYIVVPVGHSVGKHGSFSDNIEKALPEAIISERVLYVDYNAPIVNHCDVTIVPFLTNDELDIALKPVVIPKDKAVKDYPLTKNSLFVWKIESVVPVGTYALETYVISECGIFSSSSVKTMAVYVEVL